MTYCKEKLSIKSLTNIFYTGCKEEELLGLEYERLPVNKNDNTAVSYYGEFGVCELLKEFAKEDNWDYILDGKEIIGLKKIHDTITLEPGSQIELSLEPQKTITGLKQKTDEINKVLIPLFDKYDVELLNYGIYPKSTYKNIKIIPKKRYKLMANYLWGILSDVMMRETAGIQVGIDFKDEQDAIRKFNLANRLSPFITAMYANSKIRGGVDTGYKSFRALAWLNTDNERCGFATKFKQDMTFEDYVKTLLEVPLIYIVRDGKYIHMNGRLNFKKFINDGYMGYDATIDDFKLHANLFFPEIRLRNFIEIRNHDCVEERYMYSILAVYKGIFYNPDAMYACEALLDKFNCNDIAEFRYNVPRLALGTKVKGYCAGDITKEILKISADSLKQKLDSDRDFLDPIIEINSQGLSPIDLNLEVVI
ncbi:MAG: glutamate-cysteine ligase family protein [Candidatus Gastranaerophilales bacterium]|nr:glutamate-cysteine ligase family protein [Candidatus Gastranaerophilales bacterium]